MKKYRVVYVMTNLLYFSFIFLFLYYGPRLFSAVSMLELQYEFNFWLYITKGGILPLLIKATVFATFLLVLLKKVDKSFNKPCRAMMINGLAYIGIGLAMLIYLPIPQGGVYLVTLRTLIDDCLTSGIVIAFLSQYFRQKLIKEMQNKRA